MNTVKNFTTTHLQLNETNVLEVVDKKIPKVDSNHTSLAVIGLDSAFKRDDNYYLDVFLNECKYIEKKVRRHIHDNLSDFSYSSDESDEE